MYKEKYIKYKIKYFNLKSQLGGMPVIMSGTPPIISRATPNATPRATPNATPNATPKTTTTVRGAQRATPNATPKTTTTVQLLKPQPPIKRDELSRNKISNQDDKLTHPVQGVSSIVKSESTSTSTQPEMTPVIDELSYRSNALPTDSPRTLDKKAEKWIKDVSEILPKKIHKKNIES